MSINVSKSRVVGLNPASRRDCLGLYCLMDILELNSAALKCSGVTFGAERADRYIYIGKGRLLTLTVPIL